MEDLGMEAKLGQKETLPDLLVQITEAFHKVSLKSIVARTGSFAHLLQTVCQN